LRAEFPFLNTSPSTYALVHGTYARMIAERPWLGGSKGEIMTRYSAHVDAAAVRSSIESRRMRDPEMVPVLIGSFGNYHSAHSAPLDIAAKYGLPAGLLLLGAHGLLSFGYLRRFGPGLETHLVLLSTCRFLFSDPSRPSLALLFVQANYLFLAKSGSDRPPGSIP